MNRRLFMQVCLLLFLVSLNPLFAQDGGNSEGFNYGNELSQRAGTPQSPEAAAFGRYGDVAVNMYAGTPNIAVPIYTHKGRELDISLGLTYDATGIKVNQLPTPVGLGWNFDVGGRISRVVNGLPDDFISANTVGPYTSWYTSSLKTDMVEYAKNEYRFGEGYGGSHTYANLQEAKDYIEFLEKIHQQEYETQPDMYMVNAPGLSEAFVFDLETKTPYALYNPNTIIEVISGNLTTANNGGVTTFKVITDNGTQYFFDAVEETENLKDNDTQSHYQNGSRVRFISSWYLTKIISPLGKDTYEFEYTPYTDYRDEGIVNVVTEQTTVITGPEEDWTHQTARANTETKFFNREIISNIIHNDKVIVEVNATSNFGGGPDVAVTGITTYSDGTLTSGTTPMKEFDLEYSYFKTNSGVAVNTVNELNLRLKLDRVAIKDANSQEINDYSFEYHNQYEMPSLTTYGQDYLGYYNGQNTNSSLVSRTYSNSDQYPISLGYTLAGLTNGANRNVNYGFAKRGLLHKITYPTGGHTEFEYEQAQLRYAEVNQQTQTIEKVNINHAPNNLPAVDLNQCNLENAITNAEVTPSIATASFDIGDGEDGTHYLSYTKTGSPNNPFLAAVPRQAIFIKKENPLMIYTWADVFDADCNLLINPSSLIWEANGDLGTQDVSFSLDEGHYQVLIPVYDTGYSKTLTIDGPDPIQVTTYVEKPRAGIRVKTIKDYKDATTLVKQKEYDYTLSRQISNPIFEYITNEKRNPDTDLSDPSPEPEYYQLLHRVAQPINADTEHIVYRSVTEKIVNIYNPSESLTKTYSFRTPSPSQGIYGKGSYQVPLGGTGGSFSASNFSRIPSFGSNQKQSTPASSTSSTFTTERLHYQTYGLAVASIGRNGTAYPTIQSVTGGYKIIMMPPKFVANNAGAPPTPGPPDECNGDENCRPELARLMLHKTNIYGYHGAEVSQTVATTDGVTITTDYTYTDGDRRYTKTMETNGTSSNPRKTVYHYPFEMGIANSQTTSGDTTYTLTDGTVFTIEDASSSGQGPGNAITLSYSQLENANMLGQPVLIQLYDGVNDDLISRALTTYRTDKHPQYILSAKAGDMFESRMTLEQYENDNLVQARQTDGTPVSFIWGYNNRYVIAKISNIEYNSIPPSLVTAIRNASDTGNEASLLTNLETLQDDASLSNSLMTYYTYIPNIGVTTMTDETGYRMQYFYDDFQRLDRVEDQEGNVLIQNEYNYKN